MYASRAPSPACAQLMAGADRSAVTRRTELKGMDCMSNRFRLSILTAAAVLGMGGGLLGSGGVALAAPGNGNNCVGSAVSDAAHITQDVFGVGLGAYFKAIDLNPGQVIQNYATAACDKHQ